MEKSELQKLGDTAVQTVRRLSEHYKCRIEIASDLNGALGNLCCAASTTERDKQGFGKTPEEAYHNLMNQPVRQSTAKA